MAKRTPKRTAQEAPRCARIDDQGQGRLSARADSEAPQAAPPRVYTEAEKEACKRELLSHNSPAGLLGVMDLTRHRDTWPEAHRRNVSSQDYDFAVEIWKAAPSLPPLPAYTDNPAVDEKNLRQWCIVAQAPAKPTAGGKKAKAPATPQADEDNQDDEDPQATPPNWSTIMSKSNAARLLKMSVDKIDDHLKLHPEAIRQLTRESWQFDKNRPLFSRLP